MLMPFATVRAGRSPLARIPQYVAQIRLESTVAEAPADTSVTSAPMPVRYPYFVSRVGLDGMSLPVYTDIRNGGSRWLTQIRKVEGDASAFCRDLFDEFGWGDPYDKSNPYANNLVRVSKNSGPKTVFLRSNVSREIKAWLESRGF